ncbi:hypothetical protein LTR64_002373 [Lithohypha guttulata]|uniref:uncharacterized protein n=1 Tax=Lithohypha guttulata TaxID=1690604 RepID=UPI002DE1898A|nr:hypothetical protein LTR51_001402 [Lithohypha guttulata]
MASSGDGQKPNFFKRQWQKLEITPFFILLAIKGGLPATIALAAYQSYEFAEIYTTLGYIIAIMAQLSLAIQPRAKFVQSMLMNVFFICVGAATALLEIQCVIAARSTPPAGAMTGQSSAPETPVYDASACTVAAVWLFVEIFLVNTVKAVRPQLTISVIQYSIFTIVASVYAPMFPNMAAGMSFVRRLLISFLTGHAIGTGVSLFVLPVTSRGTVSKQLAGLMNLLKACIASQGAYLGSLSHDGQENEKEKAAAAKVRSTLTAASELLGKVKLELGFARKEIAFGKLSPEHFSGVFERVRSMYQPVMGMSAFLEMVQAVREHRLSAADTPEAEDALQAIQKLEIEEWNDVVNLTKESHLEHEKVFFTGLEHVSLQLELVKRPKSAEEHKNGDPEKDGGSTPRPGSAGFTKHFEQQLHRYQRQRNEIIQDWAEHKNLGLPQRFWPSSGEKPTLQREETRVMRRRLNQHQLYLVLFLNFLSFSTGESILNLVKYADSLVDDGTTKKNRFIWPGMRRIHKLLMGGLTRSSQDETLTADVNGGGNIYLGDGFNQKKDPEHLPPTDIYENVTDRIRMASGMLKSDAAKFGFRAACAAMSIGVVGYLRATRPFFLQQRGLWALIMTAISMDPHAGQGIFGFVTRIGGTVVAMVASMTIWYMCNENHAGILVVFAIYMSCWTLFMIKKPQYAVVAMISSITVILIIGYELQVERIGIQVAESNGQEAYAIYVLAPYRLATVVIGIGVAFIWTYFPYPITTHGALRQDVGATLYILANFYSCVHTTLEARLKMGPAIHDLAPNHPINKLDKARTKTFGKVLLMLTGLRNHSNFARFEPPFGGRFPRETYTELTNSIRNVFTYLALITYSSQAYIRTPQGSNQEEIDEENEWLDEFRSFAADTKITSHEITTNLCLLSAAITNEQPLPPYLRSPRPFATGPKMDGVDPSILGVQHFAHPCYAAFAVGEVASAFVTAEMAKITKLIKQLVGEVDFSFHVVKTTDDGSSTSSTLWGSDTSLKAPNGNSSSKKSKGE